MNMSCHRPFTNGPKHCRHLHCTIGIGNVLQTELPLPHRHRGRERMFTSTGKRLQKWSLGLLSVAIARHFTNPNVYVTFFDCGIALHINSKKYDRARWGCGLCVLTVLGVPEDTWAIRARCSEKG